MDKRCKGEIGKEKAMSRKGYIGVENTKECLCPGVGGERLMSRRPKFPISVKINDYKWSDKVVPRVT